MNGSMVMARTNQLLFSSLWLFLIPFVTWGMVVERIDFTEVEEFYLDEQILDEQIFLGELTGEPHLYVVTYNETNTLTLSLNAPVADEESPLSIMVVKDAPLRGVEAVARLGARDVEWSTVTDARTRVTYRSGQQYQAELEAGTYRIEISTPLNEGKYELRFGESGSSSWWQEVRVMRELQRWYGTPWWQVISSPLIYVPLFAFLIASLSGWFGYRRWRKHEKTS